MLMAQNRLVDSLIIRYESHDVFLSNNLWLSVTLIPLPSQSHPKSKGFPSHAYQNVCLVPLRQKWPRVGLELQEVWTPFRKGFVFIIQVGYFHNIWFWY